MLLPIQPQKEQASPLFRGVLFIVTVNHSALNITIGRGLVLCGKYKVRERACRTKESLFLLDLKTLRRTRCKLAKVVPAGVGIGRLGRLY